MEITRKTYGDLINEVPNYKDAEAYASDLALSSIWGDAEDAEIPAGRFEALVDLYRIFRMSVRELAAEVGLSQTDFAARFSVPRRTIQNWCASPESPSYRDCPLYVRLMMAECLGLMPFEIIK